MAASDPHSLAASRIDRYLMERAMRQREEGASSAPARPVVTISRTLGIPGKEIAETVAKQLGFHVIDRQVLDAVAQDMNLGDRIVSALEEGCASAVDAWIGGFVDYDKRVVDVRTFHHMVSRVIRGISLHGNAVILGRGANFILRGTSAFRVRLTASVEQRVAVLVRSDSGDKPITQNEARRRISEHAERRRAFVAAHFRADIDDPEAYDACLCLRKLDPAHAAGLILELYCRVAAV